MSSRNLILVVLALLIAGVTAFAIRSRISAPPVEVAQAPVTQRVLVATQDISPGSFVRGGQDIGWAAWPAEGVQAYHVTEGAEDIANFEGAVARRAIKAGEAITASSLIKPGAGGFLSAVLEPGRRAVSIAVTETSGNAGFVFPGDRVDLLVTHRVKMTDASNKAEEDTIISETFAENLRVVAVDQQLDNPENKAMLAKTITVEATPEQAQKVQVATELGRVSVSLRSLSDSASTGKDHADFVTELSADSATRNFSSEKDVSPMLSRSGNVSPRIRVMRGDQSERLEFFRE